MHMHRIHANVTKVIKIGILCRIVDIDSSTLESGWSQDHPNLGKNYYYI